METLVCENDQFKDRSNQSEGRTRLLIAESREVVIQWPLVAVDVLQPVLSPVALRESRGSSCTILSQLCKCGLHRRVERHLIRGKADSLRQWVEYVTPGGFLGCSRVEKKYSGGTERFLRRGMIPLCVVLILD